LAYASNRQVISESCALDPGYSPNVYFILYRQRLERKLAGLVMPQKNFLSTWKIIPIGILIGAVWAVWHFIPLLQAHRSMEWIAWWSLGTISLRVIMVWIYAQSGRSVFGMALFHAMINLCWQLFPINGSYYDPLVFGLLAFWSCCDHSCRTTISK